MEDPDLEVASYRASLSELEPSGATGAVIDSNWSVGFLLCLQVSKSLFVYALFGVSHWRFG